MKTSIATDRESGFEKAMVSVNIIALVYFIILAILSYHPYESTLFNAIAQIVTIPLLLVLIFSLGYSVFRIISKQMNREVVSLLVLSSLSVLFLVVLTIIQMNGQ